MACKRMEKKNGINAKTYKKIKDKDSKIKVFEMGI